MAESLQGEAGKDELEPPRLVVCFRAGIGLPPGRPTNADVEQRAPFWKEMIQRFPDAGIDPIFDERALESIERLTRRAIANNGGFRPADFRAFYYVAGVTEKDFELLLRILRAQDGVVESAYIDAPAPPPVGGGGAPVTQEFLGPARLGIDARHAWTLPGGRGQQQQIADFERGWTKDHEDLIGQNITLDEGTIMNRDRPHGTSVLGILCANNGSGRGYLGVVPSVGRVKLVAYSANSNRPTKLAIAAGLLNAGDVLLIESQIRLMDLRDTPSGPLEALYADYQEIRLATASGIIVIEAGGNGTRLGAPVDLDQPVDGTGIPFLHRDGGNPHFRDSGAILVSAARADSNHDRMPSAPFGKRVDCFAWGEGIQTLSSDELGSTTNYSTFGGTSGASAIIAGAAVAVQGWRKAQTRPLLNAVQMRATLSNSITGTDSKGAEPIGIMPDLRKILV